MKSSVRKIIHIDMDAFYASVEQRDRPDLKGRPVIVGGSPKSRGVVATCSYEARKFGIHSAMAASAAYRLCPDAVFLPVRMEAYRQVSSEIMSILRSYTDWVEPLSLDEAYLDVTVNHRDNPSATRIAREIKRDICTATGLTASAGVSYNKFIAKIASDYQKPNGLTVITPDDAQSFLDQVPVRKFFGVGQVTERRLNALGVFTGADLRALSLEQLTKIFADKGSVFYNLVRGIDDRSVEPNRIRKSIGRERTFAVDIDDVAEMQRILADIARGVQADLAARHVAARVIVLKIKFADFRQLTRRMTVHPPVQSASTILDCAMQLLQQVPLDNRVRLLGVAALDFHSDVNGPVQLTLF